MCLHLRYSRIYMDQTSSFLIGSKHDRCFFSCTHSSLCSSLRVNIHSLFQKMRTENSLFTSRKKKKKWSVCTNLIVFIRRKDLRWKVFLYGEYFTQLSQHRIRRKKWTREKLFFAFSLILCVWWYTGGTQRGGQKPSKIYIHYSSRVINRDNGWWGWRRQRRGNF